MQKDKRLEDGAKNEKGEVEIEHVREAQGERVEN